MTLPDIHIRPAGEDDSGLILHFIRELVQYERALPGVVATQDMLCQALQQFAAD